MNNNKIVLLFIVLLFLGQQTHAQQEFTMYHMSALSQSTYLNPASVPEHKLSISIPGLFIPSTFVGFNNSAFSVKAFLAKDGTVDYSKFVNSLSEDKNYIGLGAKVELFNVRFKAANNFFSLSSQVVTDFRFTYPKDLMGIAQTGINTGYSLSGLGVHLNSYLEYAAGYTHVKPDSKWTYGGRMKLLKGIANVQTKKSEIELKVDQNDLYNYDLNANMQINVGAGVDGSVYKTIDDLSNLNLSVTNFSDAKQLLKTLNKGFSVDLGTTFQFTEKASFGASLLNVGFINWKSFAQNYSINSNLSLDGVTLKNLDFKSNLDSLINVQVDSIVQTYETEFKNGIDTTSNAYKTWLPAQLFLSANYQLTPKFRTTASVYTEFFNGISVGTVVGANYRFGRSFDLTASWWWLRKSSSNLGIGLVFKPWFGQIYLVMDNILPASFVKVSDPELGINQVLLPYEIKNFNLRVGMNLVFGKIRDENQLAKFGLTKRKNGVRKYLYKPSYK